MPSSIYMAKQTQKWQEGPILLKKIPKCVFQNGYLSGLPFLGALVMQVLGGRVVDLVSRTGHVSTHNLRKVVCTLGEHYVCLLYTSDAADE